MRKLATLARIESIKPHLNADSLELATVRGWQVCIKKGEFKPGDLCVYCEIDSVLPDKPEFDFLRARGFRIKTIRLRGELSQGICFPLDVLPGAMEGGSVFRSELQEGDDVTAELGVTLYEPTVSLSTGGDALGVFPHFIPKTDEERIQNCYRDVKKLIEQRPELRWVYTEKLDGCFGINAYIPLWDGGSMTMGEIVLHGERPTLIGMDLNGNLVPCHITNVFRNGKKDNWIDIFYNPVYKSAHAGKSGRMRVTKNHKIFLSSGEEALAGDLKVSDKLISYEELPDKDCLHYIESSLLGDGSIYSKLGIGNKYSESHKASHGEFCDYIEKILGDCFSSKHTIVSGYGSNIISVQSRTYKELDRLRVKWYPNGQKILPECLEWVDDFSFAKLYMDDGSITHSEFQNDRASLATNGFTKNEVQRLAAKIEKMYGVSTSIQDSRGYCSIRINYHKGSIDNFWSAIARHIHPVFKYKLPEKYRSTEFTPYSFCKKEKKTVHVDVIGIQDVPVTKKNFPSGTIGFDLETTTHNYMCGGLLVHNSSCTMFLKDGDFGVCSRNLRMKDTPNSALWNVARRYEVEDKLRALGLNIALQGELIGPGIQGNRYHLKEMRWCVFDAFDIARARHLQHGHLIDLLNELKLDSVPVLDFDVELPGSLQGILDHAEGDSVIPYPSKRTYREGVVWRTMTPAIGESSALWRRVSFKAISNRYLLRYDV